MVITVLPDAAGDASTRSDDDELFLRTTALTVG